MLYATVWTGCRKSGVYLQRFTLQVTGSSAAMRDRAAFSCLHLSEQKHLQQEPDSSVPVSEHMPLPSHSHSFNYL